ncbi:MAG: sulfite exporter TauE/SafE family protein [Ktedonobacterales bacterium]|nr:sulfite exporter TauE/SafE family protein [Ktedonobacterales bacterium]
MTSLLGLTLFIFCASVVAGSIGSLLGLGGGVVVVPILTLVLHLPIQYAIGASIISVIATSSGAAATYVRDRLTNLRVGMFLEIGTTLGAITGAYIATILFGNVLYIIFALVLLYSMYPTVSRLIRDRAAVRGGTRDGHAEVVSASDGLATALRLDGEFYDQAGKRTVRYGVRQVPLGFAIMYGAGIASGLLGIGGGVFKVLALDNAMGMPIKASSATSNFMIGATAAASAGIYFLRGDINPVIAGPVALGVLGGAIIGTRLLTRLAGGTVRLLFALVLALVAVQMILRGFGVQL